MIGPHNSQKNSNDSSGSGSGSSVERSGVALREELEALNEALHRAGGTILPGYVPRRKSGGGAGTATSTSNASMGFGRSPDYFPITRRSTSSLQLSHPRSMTMAASPDLRFSATMRRQLLSPPEEIRSCRGSGALNSSELPAADAPVLKTPLCVLDRKEEATGSGGGGGIWKWKPFRALAHIRQQRFRVIFSVHAHSAKDLPVSLNGLRLAVEWKRKDGSSDGGMQTMPARVSQGVAEFDETLRKRCTVYGSASSGGGFKYEPKLFTLAVVALDTHNLDLGTHHLDLACTLPEHPENSNSNHLKNNRPSSWATTTRFNLAGKATGGFLEVTFGCQLLLHRELGDSHSERFSATAAGGSRREFSSHSQPNSSQSTPSSSSSSSAHRSELFVSSDSLATTEHLSFKRIAPPPSLPPSVFEFKTFFPDDGDTPPTPACTRVDSENPSQGGHASSEDEDIDFIVEEKGIEIGNAREIEVEDSWIPPPPPPSPPPPTAGDLGSDSEDEMGSLYQPTFQQGKDENCSITERNHLNGEEGRALEGETNSSLNYDDSNKAQIKGASRDVSISASMERNSELLRESEDRNGGDCIPGEAMEGFREDDQMVPMDDELNFGLSADWEEEEADLVTGEFLQMLELERSSRSSDIDESQFEEEEEEGLTGDDYWRGIQISAMDSSGGGFDEDSELASMVEVAESEMQKAAQSIRSKTRAKLLEDAETEALMQQWGLDEKAFQSSPRRAGLGQGSSSAVVSVDSFQCEKSLEPAPPLGVGLGSAIMLRGGGFLRSMNPLHFRRCRNNGKLVMQVSRSVVFPPPPIGVVVSSVMDLLQILAASGMEAMMKQAMVVMPLEDITGKTPEEVAAALTEETCEPPSRASLTHEASDTGVALESLGVLAMPSWASHSLEKEEEEEEEEEDCVPLNSLAPVAMLKIEALAMDGLRIQTDMAEEDAPSYLSAAANSTMSTPGQGESLTCLHNRDGLLSMALSLEEWARMDAGISVDVDSQENSKRRRRRGGLMGNTLVLTMLVQLRDPFRNYEPIGAPMMALIQAERVVSPKRNTQKMVLVDGNFEDKEQLFTIEEEEEEQDIEEEEGEEEYELPLFKISGVHLAGLKRCREENCKLRVIWGSTKQEQFASRWLIAHGMGWSAKLKHHSLRLKSVPSSSETKAWSGDTLWSISACVYGRGGGGENWQDITTLHPHIRNPDVIFPDDSTN